MSQSRVYFVTGTDTDAGKTFATCTMLAAAREAGYTTAAVKPVAAGGIHTQQGLQNEDALALSEHCSPELAVETINPLCFKPAIAPHIAAQLINKNVSISELAGYCQQVMNLGEDLVLIEGAGGWLVPVNDRETLAELPAALDIPVILVVSMRLGCLNHAMLTVESIKASGVELAGWIANRTSAAMDYYQENLETLKRQIPAPLIAELPWSTVHEAAKHIDLNHLQLP